MFLFGGGRPGVRSINHVWHGLCGLEHGVKTITCRYFRTTSIRSAELSQSKQAMDQHEAAVKAISATVRAFHDRKEKFRINHGSTNSTRPRNHKNVVDVGHLKNILGVDTEKKTVLVEPNVPMDRLAEGTLKHGLIPPVVMEFPGITVGGGYSGTSGESSSFKHGFFDRTINHVEMVLADGSVVKASPTEKSDLFDGAAGAMGTFGITTLVELQLLKAKKYVETTYHPVTSVQEALEVLETVTNDTSNDYVDGILYSNTSGAVITGRMTDTPPSDAPVRTFGGSWDPWFYVHVKDLLKKSTNSKPIIEAIPLAEYLFRYDRGGFWVGASAFKYFLTPFNKLTRWFLDDFLHTRMMYTALHASGQSKRYIVQDLAIPYNHVENFIDYTTTKFDIWPLWLCPLKTPAYKSMHPHLKDFQDLNANDQKMLNVGLWGFGPTDFNTFVKLNKDLERKLLELGGVRWLYAHSYESESEFWQTYDKSWYDALREKYGATGLPDVYEKVRIDVEKQRAENASWRNRIFYGTYLGGFYGIWKAIKSKSYVEARASTWKGRPAVEAKSVKQS